MQFTTCKVSDLKPSPLNPPQRKRNVTKLAKSIKQVGGLSQPIVVASNKTIIDGHRRLMACKILGLENVPIIIHSRNAENETFDILSNYKKYEPKILMHCYTGAEYFAKKLLKLNAYFSASGIITFKNSNDLQETFKMIENDKILIETDIPYLAPEPYKGQKNKPSYIMYTAEKISKILDISLNAFSELTKKNTDRLLSRDLNE